SALPSSIGPHRFRDNGELKYSLRSLEAFAPWIRKIYIVTNGQIPRWLDTSHKRISIITHGMIFPDTSHLPTFNSQAIELQLHKIPNLSRRFLYLNDDVFFGRAVSRSDFITSSGGQYIYFQPTRLPMNTDEGPVHDRAYAHTLRIIEQRWGWQCLRWLPAHVPQLYDRDILAQIEDLLVDECRETRTHRFRSKNDLVLRIIYAFFLLESSALEKGHEARLLDWGSRDYSFVCLNEHTWEMWRAFLQIGTRRRPKFFCVNDDLGDVSIHHRILWSFRQFLRFYFPKPSSFEKRL
ncbi:MAG: stealth conserved region 3 domain-containing protein, partial [Candidatus Binatia bacterium]